MSGEIIDEIRECARERENRGVNLDELTCLLTRDQYETLKDDVHRVSNVPEGGPTTVMGMPVFIVADSSRFDTPTLWKGDPAAFASEANAAIY